ncbi:MAG: 3-hydroxyacyl-ACP dehydratase FabZ [Nanoarchaeota archaeon]|nr:3-hydroxyacyl-ACP dehydratase FabZ [Nanoarchaeota archaeon]
MKFNHMEIKEVMPYDYPFLLIDEIVEMRNNNLVAKKNLSNDQLFFQGHFKDFPIMPGVLILEAIGQTGSFYIRKKKNSKDIDVLAYKIEKAEFLKPALPGDTLLIEVDINELKPNVWLAYGKVFKDKDLICKGQFYLYVAKKKEFRKKCLLKE